MSEIFKKKILIFWKKINEEMLSSDNTDRLIKEFSNLIQNLIIDEQHLEKK